MARRVEQRTCPRPLPHAPCLTQSIKAGSHAPETSSAAGADACCGCTCRRQGTQPSPSGRCTGHPSSPCPWHQCGCSPTGFGPRQYGDVSATVDFTPHILPL